MVYSIISLIISVAIIFLLRQSDKNQNSLEKTKRYVEKLHSEFEEYYAQRSKELRSVSDELRSETSQSIATVKRLEQLSKNYQASCDDIAEKHEIITQLVESMTDANNKFKQIIDMSNLVDVNIKQIKDDSKFVEAVSNTLKKAQVELNSIQNDISNMHEKFTEENDRSLENLKQSIVRTLSDQIETINENLDNSKKDTEALLEVAKIKLKDIYQTALTDATEKANLLEGEAFKTLKEQSAIRVSVYKKELDENITATRELSQRFKSAWQDEATGMLAKMQSDFTETEENLNTKLQRIDKRLNDLESDILLKTKTVDNAVSDSEKNFNSKIASTVSNLNEKIAQLTSYAESRLANVKEQTEYRFTKFDATVAEFQNSEATLKTLLASVKQNIIAAFETYKYENSKNLSAFTENFNQDAEALNEKITEIENNVEKIKAKSYENVSEKLKTFEDTFFADINEKKTQIQTTIETMQGEIQEKLETLRENSELNRKELEEQYTNELQTRLIELASSHKDKLSNFNKQITSIENSLTDRISKQDINIENLSENLKNSVEVAKENAKNELKIEMSDYMAELQDNILISKQDMEQASKKLSSDIISFEQDYQIKIETINSNFQSWKESVDKQFDSARNLFNDKISSFGLLAENAIKDFEKQHSDDIEAFKNDNSESFEKIKNDVQLATEKLETYKQELVSFSDEIKSKLDLKVAELSNSFDNNIQDKINDTISKVEVLSKNIESLNSQIDKNRVDSFSFIQAESKRLTDSMQELKEKQNEYLASTKLFERTDELKNELEINIKGLQAELNKLSVYDSAIDDLKLKYEKFSHQSEETLNKIENFMQEKSRVDLLEQEFTKLAGLSESIERKQIELEASNDEMQKYQIQIRKLDDRINEVNSRYETLDQKGEVLNQTIKDIDKAFSNLNSIDTKFKDSKRNLESLNPEIESLRNEMDQLLKNRSEITEIIDKIQSLDKIQSDVEDRMQSLQNSKEWLAGVESRLKSLDEIITQRIKLFATVYNTDEKTSREPNTSLTLVERQNIVDLHHMGWTTQQIADAMKCTIGEVELIIEMSDKYDDKRL